MGYSRCVPSASSVPTNPVDSPGASLIHTNNSASSAPAPKICHQAHECCPHCRAKDRCAAYAKGSLSDLCLATGNLLPLTSFGSVPYSVDEAGVVKRVVKARCDVGAGIHIAG